MASIFNSQRVRGVRIVSDGTKLFNNQPVIGVTEAAGGVLFADNKRTLGVDVLDADAVIHNEQPVMGVVLIADGRKLYNNRKVVPAYAITGTLGEPAAEAVAYIARMSVAPSSARQTQIDRLVKALKASDIWSSLAVLRLGWNHDQQSSLINVVGDYANAVAINAPAFVAGRGFIGNGSSAFLNFGVAYSALPLISLADHTDLVFSLTDLDDAGRDAGAMGTSGTTFIVGRTSGTLRLRANQAANVQVTVTNSVGLYGFARTGTTVEAIKNGTVRQTSTSAATTFETGNVCDLRASSSYSLRQICARVIGRYLDPTKQAALYAALLADAQAVGAL